MISLYIITNTTEINKGISGKLLMIGKTILNSIKERGTLIKLLCQELIFIMCLYQKSDIYP